MTSEKYWRRKKVLQAINDMLNAAEQYYENKTQTRRKVESLTKYNEAKAKRKKRQAAK